MLQKTLAMHLEKLKEHELTHCRISLKHAYKVDSALKSFGRYRCNDLPGEVKQVFRRILDDCQAAHERFDIIGNHGQHEGADLKSFLSRLPDSLTRDGAEAGTGSARPKCK